jgi:signal peptidase I
VSLEKTTDSVTPDPQAALAASGPIAPVAAVDAEIHAGHSTEHSTEHDTQQDAEHDTDAGPLIEPPRGAIAEWAITILLLLFLTTTLVQAYVIPTGSMEDTLLIGDHLLVDKMAFAPSGTISKHLLPYSDVKRGDIIVFRYPVDISMTFVKRAIGIPGDRLRLVNKQVYRNGVKLDEPYKVNKSDQIDAYRDNFPSEPNSMIYPGAMDMLQNHVVNGEVVVPPGTVFAMGDNRDSSLDSRYWGFVPRGNIIGKPLIIYWSYDAPSDELQNPAIGLDHLKDLALNFFSKTRWRRTFKLIHGYYAN